MTVSSLFSYIDPGSGAILLQVVIAGVIGSMIFFRATVSRIVRFVTRRSTISDQGEGENGGQSAERRAA